MRVSPYIDRIIGAQVARVAFGDSRRVPPRHPAPTSSSQRAIDLLQRANTQQELFSLTPAAQAAKH